MRLKIKRLDPAVGLPEAGDGGAAGFDLASAVDIEIPPRSIRLVGTGLVIAVPEGHFLGIFARSSTPLKRGLMVANGVGVVDADYCGPGGRDQDSAAQHHRRTRAGRARRSARTGDRAAVPARSSGRKSTEMRAPTRGGFGSTGLSDSVSRLIARRMRRSSTSTWTRSTRRWNSATTRRCAASRSRSAAIRPCAAWWRRPATRRARSACARRSRCRAPCASARRS